MKRPNGQPTADLRKSGEKMFKRRVLWVVFASLLASCGYAQDAVLLPNTFGTQDYTVTVVDAVSFTADTPFTTDYNTMSRHFPGATGGHFFASLNIPSGVVVDFIGTNSRCTGTATMVTEFLRTDRTVDAVVGIVGYTQALHDSFDTDFAAPSMPPSFMPLGYQFTQNADNALILHVFQQPDPDSLACDFRYVEIWWRRVVSPAPPAATFNDVPISSPQFQFIEALAAAGITAGCGGGNYCPESSVTRGQMAVFLAKALGLHWPN